MNDDEKKKLGENLKRMVNESGMSAMEFSRQLEVNYDTVMKWFSGSNTGFLKRVSEIIDILNSNIPDLYKGTGKEGNPIEKHDEIAYLKGRIDTLEKIVAGLLARGDSENPIYGPAPKKRAGSK